MSYFPLSNVTFRKKRTCSLCAELDFLHVVSCYYQVTILRNLKSHSSTTCAWKWCMNCPKIGFGFGFDLLVSLVGKLTGLLTCLLVCVFFFFHASLLRYLFVFLILVHCFWLVGWLVGRLVGHESQCSKLFHRYCKLWLILLQPCLHLNEHTYLVVYLIVWRTWLCTWLFDTPGCVSDCLTPQVVYLIVWRPWLCIWLFDAPVVYLIVWRSLLLVFVRSCSYQQVVLCVGQCSDFTLFAQCLSVVSCLLFLGAGLCMAFACSGVGL